MAGQLSVTDALTVLDSMAAQINAIINNGYTAGATGYTNNRATILATADFGILSDLATAFANDATGAYSTAFATRLAALEKNLGGISAFLSTNNKRVHSVLKTGLSANISVAQLFAPVAYTGATRLARVVVTGSGVGTVTLGPGVYPVASYGPAWCQIKNTAGAVVGAASIVATVVGKHFDQTTVTKNATLANGAANNAVSALGAPGTIADNIVQVTGITFTGGTSGDQFDVETVLERTVTL